MKGALFVGLVCLLQLGAVVSYVREAKYPDALFFVGCIIANAAIIWRTA